MTQIDQSIVQMKFDNQEFERRASTTMSTLDKLKSKLTLRDSAKAMQESVSAINNSNFDSLSRSAEKYGDTLSSKVIAKLTVVQGLMNKVMSAGENMVKSLAIDPVSSGWDKYESKLAQTQTIMNATGKSAEDVETYLEKLMWYADETSYSFDDMTRSVGNFTSAGVDINKAIPAVIGIANAGGLAGTSIQNVSHAMEGFAKAIGQGYMQANQWDWIETARINTEATKQAFIDAAVELGKLQKQIDGSYLITGTTDKFVSAANFTANFREQWLDTDVMLKGLQNFGDYSEAVFQMVQEEGISTADAMDALSGKYNALGEQGMRAAQESKTLGDAIQAVRDAVSTGWLRSFQTIFGGFEEAKELWATVYDELYEIFAAAGDARNDLLSEWADLGGREVLLDTIWEGWNKIKEVVGTVKEGIRDVFPQKTAEQIYNATLEFQKFVKSLKLSEDSLYSIRVIAKTLALPFKLLAMAAKTAGLGLKVFIYYASRAVDTLLTMASNAEYAEEVFKNIFKTLFGEVNGERIYNSLSNIFTSIQDLISTKIAELKSKFNGDDLGFLSFFSIDKLKETKDKAKEIVGDMIADLLEAIDTGNWDNFTKGIGTVGSTLITNFSEANKVVSEFLANVLHLDKLKLPEFKFESFKEFLEAIKDATKEFNPFSEGIEFVKEKGSDLVDIIVNITKAIIEFTKNLSPSKILIFGFGLSIINLITQFANLTNATANVVTSFSGIGKSAKGILDAFKKRIMPIESKFKNLGDMILKIAVAIGILAIALYKLSDVPAAQLEEVTNSMLKLIGVFGGITVLLSIIAMISSKSKGLATDINSLSINMLAFAAAIGVITAALYILDGTDIEDVGAKLLLISGVVVGASIAISALSKFKVTELNKSAAAILAFAASVYVITMAIDKLDPQKALASIPYLITVFGMLSITMLSARVAGANASKATSGILKLSLALGLMTGVIALTGYLFKEHPQTMVVGAVTALIEFLGFMIPLAILTRVGGEAMKSAGKGIKQIASAITLLVVPITILGLLPQELVWKGISTVSAMLLVMSAISHLAGVGKDKAVAQGLKQVALAVTLLVIPIAILGYMDADAVGQGLLAVTAMLAVLGVMSRFGSVAKDAKIAIMPAVAAIGIFTTAILLLSIQDWESVKRSTAALSVAVLALGSAMRMMSSVSKTSKPSDFKNMIVSVAALGVLMAGIIGILATTKDMDGKEVAAKLGGLAVAMVAIGEAVNLMGNSSGRKMDIKKALINIAAVGAFMAEAAWLLKIMGDTYADWTTIIANSAALSMVLLSAAASIRIMSDKKDYTVPTRNLKAVAAFIAEAAGVIFLMSRFGSQNWQVIIANGEALTLVLMAVGASVALMSKGQNYTVPLRNVQAMGAFLAEAAIAIGILAYVTNGVPAGNLIAIAVSLSLILAALAGSVVLMSNFKGKHTIAIETLGGMSLFLLAASAALAILANCPTDGMLEKAESLSLVLVTVSGIAVLFGKISIDPAMVTKGMEGVLVVVAAVALIVSAISLVAGLINKISEESHAAILSGLERIKDVFVKIGEVLGGFAGGLVAGFNDAATSNIEEIGTRMANFIDNISTSIDNVTKYDESLLAKLDNFKSAITKIKEAALEAKIVNTDNLNSFSAGIIIFADNYTQFADKIEGVTSYSVTAGTEAMSSLATMTDTLAGVKKFPDMSKFGTLINDLAPYLITFSTAVGNANFTPAKVTSATNAAAAVAGFAETIGKSTDGYNFIYSGGTALADFGYQLSSFGISFNTFASNIKTVDQGVVDGAIAAASSIAAFAETLPLEGGLLEALVGKTMTLGQFATDMSAFAEAWPAVAEKLASAEGYSGAVTACADAAEAMSKLANGLPEVGGWYDTWFGATTTLSTFAEDLTAFAEPWVAFSAAISPAASYSKNVKTASEAAVETAKIYDELPTEGGALTTWFFGTKFNLATFGQDINSFGWNFKMFSESAKSIDKQACIDASEAVSAVIATYAKLPTTGGWLDQITKGETVDISVVAQSVKDMGQALVDFNAATQGVLAVRISGLAQAMEDVVDASKKLGEFKNKNVKNFKDNVASLKEAFSELTKVVEELPDKTEIEDAMASFDSLFGDSGTWVTYGEELITNMQSGALAIVPTFVEEVRKAIVTGFDNEKTNLTNSLKNLIQNVAYAARTNSTVKSKVKQVGIDIINGIKNGFNDKTARDNLNKALANALLAAVQFGKEAIDSHSPSKLTEKELGAPIMQGAAVGVEKDKTLRQAMAKKLKDFVSEFKKYLTTDKSITNAVKMGLKQVSLLIVPNAAERGREAGEAFGEGIVEGLKSVNFNRATIDFGKALVPSDGLKELAKETKALQAVLDASTAETTVAKGSFNISGTQFGAESLNDFASGKLTGASASEAVYEFKKLVKDIDFDLGFTFDDLANYFDNLDMDRLSASSRVFVTKVKPIIKNVEDGLDVIDSFTSFMEDADFDIDKTSDLYKQYDRITEVVSGSITMVGEVEEAVHLLQNLEGYNLTLAETSTNRVKAITDALEQQAGIVNEAEQRYFNTVAQYGTASELTQASLVAWTQAKLQFKAYEKELDNINRNGAQSMLTSTTKYATMFIDTVRDAAEELREYVGTEGSAYVELVDRLQSDISDGIINDPRIINALEQKFADILSMFDGLMGRRDTYSSIAEKQYNLWLSTEGRGASDTEKNEKRLSMLNQQMKDAAEKQYIANKAFQEATAMYGSSSDEALEAQEKYLDAYQQLVDLAEERAKIEHEISISTSNTANSTNGANQDETERQLTAREKAEKEFQEWKQDGSLREWHYYGATDEELMDALIKKYEKEERDALNKAQETAKETQDEYIASFEEISAILGGAIEGIDTEALDKSIGEGMNNVVAKWAAEWLADLNQELESKRQEYINALGIGMGGTGGGGTGGLSDANDYLAGEANITAMTLSDFNKSMSKSTAYVTAATATFKNLLSGEEFAMTLTPEELLRFYGNPELGGRGQYEWTNQEAYMKEISGSFQTYMKNQVRLENVEGNLKNFTDPALLEITKNRENSVAILGLVSNMADSILAIATDVRRDYGTYNTPEYVTQYGGGANEAEKAFWNSDVGQVLRWIGVANVPDEGRFSDIMQVTDEMGIKALNNILSASEEFKGMVGSIDVSILKEIGQYATQTGMLDFFKGYDSKTGYLYDPTVVDTGRRTYDATLDMWKNTGFVMGNVFGQTGDVDITKFGLSVVYDADGYPHIFNSSQVQDLVSKKGYSYYESNLSPSSIMNAGRQYTYQMYQEDIKKAADAFSAGAERNRQLQETLEKAISLGPEANARRGMPGYDENGQPIGQPGLLQQQQSNAQLNVGSANIGTVNLGATTPSIADQIPQTGKDISTAITQSVSDAVGEYMPDSNSLMNKLDQAGDKVTNAAQEGFDWLSNQFNGWFDRSEHIEIDPKGAASVGDNLGGAMISGFSGILKDSKNGFEGLINTSVKSMDKMSPLYGNTGKLFSTTMFNEYNKVFDVQSNQLLSKARTMAATLRAIMESAYAASSSNAFGGGGSISPVIVSGTHSAQVTSNATTSSDGVKHVQIEIAGRGSSSKSNGSASTVVNNYNQTINSPKAVSRYDVYRDTKNLLSQTKGAGTTR